jgi:hypothetical protein
LGGVRHYRCFGVDLAAHDGLVLRANEIAPPVLPDLEVRITSDEPRAPWHTAEERYQTPPATDGAEPGFRFLRLVDRDLIRVRGTGDVHVLDQALIFHLRNADHRYLVEIILLGLGMAFWLERRGEATLHASSVALESRAVAFVGVGGMGKSSMAAHLVANGDELLTEDLLRLDRLDREYLVQPAVAQFRLWPESAAELVPEWERLEQPHPGFTKRKLPVGPGGLGTFAAIATPLRAIYVLNRTSGAEGPPVIDALPPASRLAELLRHSFLPDLAGPFGWQARRLEQLARLSTEVPVRSLRYESGAANIPRVREVILRDVLGT